MSVKCTLISQLLVEINGAIRGRCTSGRRLVVKCTLLWENIPMLRVHLWEGYTFQKVKPWGKVIALVRINLGKGYTQWNRDGERVRGRTQTKTPVFWSKFYFYRINPKLLKRKKETQFYGTHH